MIRRLSVAAIAVVGMLVFTAAAGAEQLGITSLPAGASLGPCPNEVFGQYTDDPSTPYIIPAGGGTISGWQTDTADDVAGGSLTFVVIAPTGSNSYTVSDADTETLPDPLPADNVAEFELSQPILAAGGDTLGIFSSNANQKCFISDGATPADDALFTADLTGASPPIAGEPLGWTGNTVGGFAVNVGATFTLAEDPGVTAASSPTSVTLGGSAVLRSVVTNSGPGTGPITLTDTVPSGLQIVSAAAGLGSCNIGGQTVTCTISGLPVGQSATVDLVVTPTAAGSYANAVSVTAPAGVYDPTASNNTASSTLVVAQPAAAAAATPTTPTAPTTPTRACIVPKLPRIPSASARKLLTELGCTVHVSTEHSSVTKGLVIGVKGKAGSFPYHQSVTLIVSSGKKPKKRR